MIRTLALSRELKVFLAVTTVLTAAYLYATTGEHTRKHAKTAQTPADVPVGKTVDLSITLITADATGLACGSDTKVGNARCAFKGDGTPYPKDDTEPKDIIAPYMTADNVLFLIPGLWQEPALAKRLQDEPPAKYERDQLRRFNANCKFTSEQKLPNFKVRWQPTAGWGDKNEPATVGRISDCKIEDT
jgi:hypothetical protein